ncbi:MAG: radical SAM protein [Nocardioidaceae bacterium]|nr:radical SAM protein [Nocardioidaceae bacterium]
MTRPSTEERHGAKGAAPAVEFDGGNMDCGSGLLLSITSAMRRIGAGEVLLLHTREPSVLADLPAWARLAGHELLDVRDDGGGRGPWRLSIRRGSPRPPAPRATFTEGTAVPLGSRLWLYSNFHCNLACSYCCAESSPKASARLMPVEVAAAATSEFVAQGGRELLVTGGEPFLHPQLGTLLAETASQVPVTLLTNAMVFQRGTRRETLEALDRKAVTLQVSLDSAEPGLHDRQRGAGSHAKAMTGIRLARELGFRVRVAATLQPEDAANAEALHVALDAIGIDREDRVIRPVAEEGFAAQGVHISLDTVEPEPTLTADGAWWHPVAVTNPHLKVADTPLPVEQVLDVMRDVIAVQVAGNSQGRAVFRCT